MLERQARRIDQLERKAARLEADLDSAVEAVHRSYRAELVRRQPQPGSAVIRVERRPSSR